jgi:hypothetical protein
MAHLALAGSRPATCNFVCDVWGPAGDFALDAEMDRQPTIAFLAGAPRIGSEQFCPRAGQRIGPARSVVGILGSHSLS